MNDDVQRVLRSMGLEDAQPAQTGEDDVTRVLRSMGLHDEQSAPQKSYTGLSDLAGFKTPEESIASFSPQTVERINEYGPAAAAGLAGLLLPGSGLVGAAAGLGLGALARGASSYFQNSADAAGLGGDHLRGNELKLALDEANPFNHPGAALLEGGLPFFGKAVGKGLAAKPLSDLPDYVQATSLDAPLPKLDELTSFTENAGPAAKLEGMKGLRADWSAAAPYLLKGETAAKRIAGDRTMAYGEVERFLDTNGKKIIAQTFKGLSPEERVLVRSLMKGEVSPTAVSSKVVQAADDLSSRFYDPMGNVAERSGMLTQVKEVPEAQGDLFTGMNSDAPQVGDWIPFRKRQNYAGPDIPLSTQESAAKLLRSRLFKRGQVAYQKLEDPNELPLMTDAQDIALAYLDNMKSKIAAAHAFGSPTKGGKYGEIGEQLLKQLESENDPLATEMFNRVLNRVYTGVAPTPTETMLGKLSGIAARVQLGKAALRSIPQIATNIRQNGVSNTIEGLTRYATDPSLRNLLETSGAKSPAVAEYAAQLGAGRRTIPVRMQTGIERGNRGIFNSGIVPQIEKLAEAARRGPLNSAQRRILAELRISEEELRGAPRRVSLIPTNAGGEHLPDHGVFNYDISYQGEHAGNISGHSTGNGNVLIDWMDLSEPFRGSPRVMVDVKNALRAAHPEFSTYSAMRTGGGRGGSVVSERSLGTAPSDPGGGITADLIRRVAQRSADDNQLQAGAIGMVGDRAHDQPYKFATQYQPFQWAQWRNFQDRVLAPLRHPIDRPADFLMGLRRASVGVPTAAALSAPVTALYAMMANRDGVDPKQVISDILETTTGTVGSAVGNGIQGRKLSAVAGGAPTLGLLREEADSLDRIIDFKDGIPTLGPDAGRGSKELLIDLIAALDPTGAAAVLRSPLRARAAGR